MIMVLPRLLFSQLPRHGMIATRRMSTGSSTTPSTEIPAPTEHRVLLDNQTLYISQELAEGLGWKPNQSLDGVKLSLHGWEPSFFTITPTGTDFESLSKRTVESSRNKNVHEVLSYLKDR